MSLLTERDELVDELRRADKLLLTTHENPDGDALGSLLGMHLVLEQLGKDSVMFLAANQFPLPYEYQRMQLDEVRHELPDDINERTVVFLDCGNIDRTPVHFLQRSHLHVLNIDHHHDNTRFGTVNLVVPEASCAAEIVYDLAKELGAEITPLLAEALYIGLTTDTGKFMFENTTPEAHVMAAELIEAGVQPQDVHRKLYEELPFARLQLLARALNSVHRFDDGAITLTHITREDFDETGAGESDSEGIVDHMRQVEGTVMAALVRELLAKPGMRKVSLRSTDGRVDVSIIARGLGGGGHRQAAGFTTDLPFDELVERLRTEMAAQL
ncbi:MAG: bifunctional oligoribonuclease and phosphatase NrnA [Thermoleophilaceae bacterium]|nr:bifunctional oligoribonuclease and phosphatase NrnA [Thermoleophilaceae bacterium]